MATHSGPRNEAPPHPAELAGVLGHEVGHVVGRHGAEHLAKQQLGQGLVCITPIMAPGSYFARRDARRAALQRASKGRGTQPEFFQTHPDPENRIARLRELVGDDSGHGDLGEDRYRDRVLFPLGERADVRGKD